MIARPTKFALSLTLLVVVPLAGQVGAQEVPEVGPIQESTVTAGTAPEFRSGASTGSFSGTSVVRYEEKPPALDGRQGQVWREYDIRSYTEPLKDYQGPERTIVEWILRETGADLWNAPPLGLLSADRDKVYVYHTREVQQRVEQIIDRFVRPELKGLSVSVQLVSIETPSWRVEASSLMRPVPVQSPGIDAWLVSRENAALLMANWSQRVDFQPHATLNVQVLSGHSYLVENFQPRSYAQWVQPAATNFNSFAAKANYHIVSREIREGYSMQISPLAMVDGQTMETVIQCSANQIEKLSPMTLELPAAAAGQQPTRVPIEVPQISSWQMHERFRWPVNEVLVISRGVVAMPGHRKSTFGALPTPWSGPARADALLFLSCRPAIPPPATPNPVSAAAPQPPSAPTEQATLPNYRGRY